MDGSSEFGWQRSDGSRRLNSSDVSDRNPRLISASSIRSIYVKSHKQMKM